MRYYLAITRRHKTIVVLISACILLWNTLTWMENGLRPTAFAIAEAKTNRIAATVISRTVSNILEKEKTNLIYTTIDENGKITLIQPDTRRFNILAAHITDQLETEIESLHNIPINIPIGQLLGMTLFANSGPYIPIVIKPTGKIFVSAQDSFQHVGINQTKHRMYLDVRVDICIVIPLSEKTTTVQTTVPLAEYIIVGDTPQTYVEIPQNILK